MAFNGLVDTVLDLAEMVPELAGARSPCWGGLYVVRAFVDIISWGCGRKPNVVAGHVGGYRLKILKQQVSAGLWGPPSRQWRRSRHP